ncbi:alpha/beta hydrolase [Rhodanobacter sp. 7MK24]|uniref:alpha/beta hydrolase n=1 Tax=Rhodanobacter sp. 7MK24 TaxID=2775922 RepID=UPI00177B5EE0|nr:alpha/beta hydrolase [Rhodanobacter sp. 7MK24]MBD8880250.1 alpha/beta hydrolase [Rhodanobacter sp. 7MK24]
MPTISRACAAVILGMAFMHAASGATACSAASTFQAESAGHHRQFVSVTDGVRLEVLDWGGTGRPLVLLPGLGNTAHVFDSIAPALARHFHVYGITGRGFGASSIPKSGYGADRLADDVMAVVKALDIRRPILAGHSIAGEELSAIGTRYQSQIAGLIYLDAAHGYAIYDPDRGAYLPDLGHLAAQISRMHDGPSDKSQMTALLDEVSVLQRSLRAELAGIAADDASTTGAAPSDPTPADLASFPAFRCFVSAQLGGVIPEDEIRQTFAATATGGVGEQKAPAFVYNAILEGEERFHAPDVPILAIVPVPRASDLPVGSDKAKRQAAEELHTRMQEQEIATLQRQQPSATVVRIPYGHHFIFLSNPTEVVSAMIKFGAQLP